jgi:hypothetical protein
LSHANRLFDRRYGKEKQKDTRLQRLAGFDTRITLDSSLKKQYQHMAHLKNVNNSSTSKTY